MAKRYSAEVKEQMIALFREGMSLKEISQKHGMSVGSLENWIADANLKQISFGIRERLQEVLKNTEE